MNPYEHEQSCVSTAEIDGQLACEHPSQHCRACELYQCEPHCPACAWEYGLKTQQKIEQEYLSKLLNGT